MNWILYTILGALFIGIGNTFFRWIPQHYNISIWTIILLLIPLIIIAEYGIGMGYMTGPKFLTVWFFGNALILVSGFIFSSIVFKEIPVFIELVGIGIIIFGAVLLASAR